ncbi:unnamed protein product [Durusdinium trenchii]|uniref:Uncharacterized protein n=2 Tax=Durusdinium trenchii TaxID=1381693 RepID=A0ABP0IWN1_9DINO
MSCRCCRRCIPSTICGADVSDLFAYSTTKYIKIRDARLGLLHYGLMFLIVVYILVYQLIGKLGYLKFNDAQNTVRLTLQEPTQGCNPNDTGCKDNFASLSQLPYCCAQNSSCKTNSDGSCSCDYRTSFKDYNCTWLSGTDASVIRESSIVVATFIHEYDQSLNTTCFNSYPSAANNCDDLWLIQEKASLFAADVEAFTMLIDHSVTSPKSGLATTSRQMQGMLFVGDNGNDGDVSKAIKDELCRSNPKAVTAQEGGSSTDHSPCYVPPNSADGLDYFSVGTLLQATGVTLEGESYPGSGHSARYEGLTINLLIDYSNSRDWHGLQPNISYLYKPSVVPQSTFKTTLLSPSSLNGQQMLKKDIHGVLFEVRPSGQLAVFDFTQLLLQLTTSLTLLALATVGVNILAQYVLRYRHYYSEALYDRTADFDNISFLESQSDNHLRQELEDRNLPTSGTRERMILRLMEYGYRPPRPTSTASSERCNLSSAREP